MFAEIQISVRDEPRYSLTVDWRMEVALYVGWVGLRVRASCPVPADERRVHGPRPGARVVCRLAAQQLARRVGETPQSVLRARAAAGTQQ